MIKLRPLAAALPSTALNAELAQLSPLATLRDLCIYVVQGDQHPQLMQEIGRIRELRFRQASAGRGQPRDLDPLDYGERSYRQLVVWDPRHRQIVALYRFQLGQHGAEFLRTANLFNYSHTFAHRYLPHAIELGRSVVNPEAQARKFGFFALWRGLEALLDHNPKIQYFFGNVSLYQALGPTAQATIVAFCQHYYRPEDALLSAKPELQFAPTIPLQLTKQGPDAQSPVSSRARAQQLQQLLTPLGQRVPPVLQSYLSLGSGIYFDDAALDTDFADAIELSIVVPVTAIDVQRRQLFSTTQP